MDLASIPHLLRPAGEAQNCVLIAASQRGDIPRRRRDHPPWLLWLESLQPNRCTCSCHPDRVGRTAESRRLRPQAGYMLAISTRIEKPFGDREEFTAPDDSVARPLPCGGNDLNDHDLSSSFDFQAKVIVWLKAPQKGIHLLGRRAGDRLLIRSDDDIPDMQARFLGRRVRRNRTDPNSLKRGIQKVTGCLGISSEPESCPFFCGISGRT